MDEPQEVFYLTTIDQARTMADTLRVRLFEHLVRQPLTVTQLGEVVGETPAKVHYHVRELERIGVVRLVETREKGGILEKYYRAVAKSLNVSPDLLRSAPQHEVVAMVNEYLQWVSREALKAVEFGVAHTDQVQTMTLSSEMLWATRPEFQALLKEVAQRLKDFANPRGIAGEQEWTFTIIAHQQVPSSAPSPMTPAQEEAPMPQAGLPSITPFPPLPPMPPTPPTPPSFPSAAFTASRLIFAAGDIRLTRKDLEQAAADHRPYDITLMGVVRIDDDVPAELVERAVRRFRHLGKLVASPEVRAVLRAKSSPHLDVS